MRRKGTSRLDAALAARYENGLARRCDALGGLFRGLRWLQRRGFRRAGREFRLALRTSEQPLTTGTRIVWFAMALPILNRTATTRRAVSALVRLRQRLEACA